MNEPYIENILVSIIILIFFYTFYKVLFIKTDNQKISNNALSALHAIGVSVLYPITRSSEILCKWSIPYFLLDSALVLKYSKKIDRIGLTIHHLIAIYILFNSINTDQKYRKLLLFLYFIVELSNIPMYSIIHLLNIKYSNEKVMEIILLVQIFVTILARLIVVPMSPLIDLDSINKGNIKFLIISLFIYVFSIVWISKLWTKFINKYQNK